MSLHQLLRSTFGVRTVCPLPQSARRVLRRRICAGSVHRMIRVYVCAVCERLCVCVCLCTRYAYMHIHNTGRQRRGGARVASQRRAHAGNFHAN